MENGNAVDNRSLKEIVDVINNRLVEAAQEDINIIQINTIGKKQFGFKPQVVFNKINEVLGPDNWRYETKDFHIFEKDYSTSTSDGNGGKKDVIKTCNQVMIETTLFIRSNGEWIKKGTHFGQCNIILGNVGDACKGAVTDSLQKAFSTISVGQLAYAGQLEKLYNELMKRGSQSKQQKQSQSQQPSPQPPITGEKADLSDHDLPVINGIDFIINENRFIASGEKNALYNSKAMLKSGGFQWSGTEKIWFKEIPQQQ